MPLTLQDLLKARRVERLEVPEFGTGVVVWVRGMTVSERDRFCLECSKDKSTEKIMAARNIMVASCLVDEAGQALCVAADQVLGLDGGGVERIAKRIQELSGFGSEGNDEKKALATTQSEPSATGSPRS